MAGPKKETRICEICGNAFSRYRTYMRTPGSGRYCSRKCFYARNGTRVQRVCEVCGKQFELRPSEMRTGAGRFCSRGCYWGWQKENTSGVANNNYKAHIRVACRQCGEVFEALPTANRVYCSQKCKGVWMSDNIVGSSHPLWRGGRDGYPSGWTTLRRKIRENGVYACGLCRMSEQKTVVG